MQKFCEQCGSVLHEGDKFCDSCGTAVPEINNVQSSQNVSNSRQTSSRPSRNNTAKIFIPIVLVAALMILGIWAGMNYFQTEKEVVTESANCFLGWQQVFDFFLVHIRHFIPTHIHHRLTL